MGQPLSDPSTIKRYVDAGWWGTKTLAEVVAGHAATRPDAAAFIETQPDGDRILTWAEYDWHSSQLAATLVDLGLEAGSRVGVILPDGAAVHVAFLAAEKAGCVVAGIGARAGYAEVRHLLARTKAAAVITGTTMGDQPTATVLAKLRADGAGDSRVDLRHIVMPDWGAEPPLPVMADGRPMDARPASEVAQRLMGRALGPDDLFMLNSTSGTTGLPKCVMHAQNRWFYFHQVAAEAGGFTNDEVFLGAVPAPFGFGLWTAHFTPAILGAPTVVAPRFDAESTLRQMARHRVTVLACVSTQFIMMLNTSILADLDLSSLRVMFTGGEAVPYLRAAAFEQLTGATVLQFYGSNETGAISRTRLADTRQQRLGTAGRVIDAMQVRVFDESGAEVTDVPRVNKPLVGIPAGKGPAMCAGYYDDEEANDELFTDDGWMLMGDVVEIDLDGYLRVVGRTSDFIIRGGKNISAPALEAEVAEHPDVALVAAVAMPDEVFGERVCIYVVPRRSTDRTSVAGAETVLCLADIVAFLRERGVSREWFPERLELVDELPRSSGGKVAKGQLRDDIRRRVEAHDEG